jgi:hypothetical protein
LLEFSAKVGDGGDIFKTTIGNESLHETNNDNRFRVVNTAIPKMQLSRTQCSHITKIHELQYSENEAEMNGGTVDSVRHGAGRHFHD